MQDTRMRKGMKVLEIIAELLQMLGTAKPFFMHGRDWFRLNEAKSFVLFCAQRRLEADSLDHTLSCG